MNKSQILFLEEQQSSQETILQRTKRKSNLKKGYIYLYILGNESGMQTFFNWGKLKILLLVVLIKS